MTIRPANAADLPAVAGMARRLGDQHHDYDPARFVVPDLDTYTRFFAAERTNPATVLLVAGDDPPAGYLFGRLEPACLEALAAGCGWVHDLYLAPAARGTGAGGRLLDAGIAALRAKGAGAVMLSASPRNRAARRLFVARGFRLTMAEMRLDLVPPFWSNT